LDPAENARDIHGVAPHAKRIERKMFGDRPLGPWPDRFDFVHDLGCAYSFVGFVVFVIAVLVLWRYVLN
jgi:hypothetical protein